METTKKCPVSMTKKMYDEVMDIHKPWTKEDDNRFLNRITSGMTGNSGIPGPRPPKKKNPFVDFKEKADNHIVQKYYGNADPKEPPLDFVNTTYTGTTPRDWYNFGIEIGQEDNDGKFWLKYTTDVEIPIGNNHKITIKTDFVNVSRRKNNMIPTETLYIDNKEFFSMFLEPVVAQYKIEKTGYIDILTFSKDSYIVSRNKKGKVIKKLPTTPIPKYIVEINGKRETIREDDMILDVDYLITEDDLKNIFGGGIL